jgi:DNA modification methylase
MNTSFGTQPRRAALYHRSAGITLYTGSAETGLNELPDASIDCLVTSPPYWRLRDYAPNTSTEDGPACGHQSQIGLETTAEDYLTALRQVFRAARRVLTPRATLWINLGDSYSTNSDGYRCAAPGQAGQPRYRPRADVPHKNLLGMPWRLALALQEDGWILRNAIVWNKPHPTPSSIRDRLTCRHEMLFLFVTQPDYYFDLEPIRQPYTGDRALSRRAHHGGTKPNTVRSSWPRTDSDGNRGRNPGNVWTIPPDRSRGGHPAPSPLEIPRRCIASGSPPSGRVLDPFSGASTTGVVARQLGRSYVGVDINPEFHELGLRRLPISE